MNVTSGTINVIMSYKSIIYFLSLLLIHGGLLSCSKEKQVPVPFVYVNYAVYLNLPANSMLKAPFNYLIIPDRGNLGIILYRRSIGEPDDFVAFDLTCTNEPLGSCKVAVDSTKFYLVCPCCKSKFQIIDGMVAAGPAKWPLKEYATQYSTATNTVLITN